MSVTFVERYIAFLRAELPKLQARALKPKLWRAHKRIDVLNATLAEVAKRKRPGICLELGVHKGESIRCSARRLPKRQFYGFDSFEGLPDDGRFDWQQDFAVSALPEVPSNVTLIKGWFSDTLPEFLREHDEPIVFIHIDCDIYSSTCDVFRCLQDAGRLQPDVVICFDDLLNYNGYLWNEMLALYQLLERSGYGVKWLAAHSGVYTIDETLELHDSGHYPTWEQLRARGYRQQAALVLTDRGGWDVGDREDVRALAQTLERITTRRFAKQPSTAPW